MIQRLVVHNFRGLDHADLTFDPRLTLVLGPNGAGKSSLAGAIEYALTGACEWTDGAGHGAGVLIADGTSAAGVDLSADFGILGKTISGNLTKGSVDVAFGNRTGKEALAAIGAALPASGPLLTAMLRTDGFLRLPSKDQQNLLFSLAGGETDAAWFKERLSAAEAKALDSHLSTLLRGSALADSLYQAAFTLRAAANKRVKELQGQATGAVEPEPVDMGPLDKSLTALRAKLAKVNEKIGAADEQVKAQQLASARWQQENESVKRVQQALDALGEAPADVAVDVAGLQAAAHARQAEYADAIQAAAEANAVRQTLQDQLERFVALGDKCVLGGVVCPMDKAARGKIIKQTQASIDKLEVEIRKQHDAATAAEQAHNEAGDAVDDARRTQAEAAQWTDRKGQLAEQLAQAEQRRDAAQAEYQQAAAPNVSSLRDDAENLKRQIDQVEEQLHEAREAANAASLLRVKRAELAQAQDEAAMLDGLVKKLGPDGLPAQAMQETLGDVIAQINDVLGQFTEITLSMAPGKDGEVWADFVNDRGQQVHLPARAACESERLRIGAAIQVAFALLTGFGFVVVDAADRLDNVNRPLLLGMLLGSGVQALVLATPANGHVPQAEGLTVYTLAGGTASAVAEEAAA